MHDKPKEQLNSRRILVAGDVCLDIIGVPVPPTSDAQATENWRLTGETRTHFLPGGAMLLAKFIRAPRLAEPLAAAQAAAEKEIQSRKAQGKLKDGDEKEIRFAFRDKARRAGTRNVEDEVVGPRPLRPAGIAEGVDKPLDTPLYQDEFIGIAERLRRDEIVHSLIAVKPFATTNNKEDKSTTLRVEKEHGYSGPVARDRDPSLKVVYPPSRSAVDIIVLDDTGNRFRKGHSGKPEDDTNPWPPVISQPDVKSRAAVGAKPLIIYKLHRPLPSAQQPNNLWMAVRKHHPHNRVVIISVGDLRHAGTPISMGLSWERTALDVVWHLQHFEAFAELKECPQLVVRLGLDGAVLWQSCGSGALQHQAWLIYDPKHIEGSFAHDVPGSMVACGSAFTAAFVQHLAAIAEKPFSALLKPVAATGEKPTANPSEGVLLAGIKNGLLASRRLLQLGFGDYLTQPNYPGPELFDGKGNTSFCSHPIEMIPGANEPDRNYWRLLDSVFKGQPRLLHTAGNLNATRRKEPGNDEERKALDAIKRVPVASYGALSTRDRGEIESYRALHTLLRDYLGMQTPQRPLSIGVFGPPGSGKSFGVKEVAASLKNQSGCKEVEDRTFNLSLYQAPEELSGAFHLVRDVALRGKVPLVFFDEFDTALGGQALGWLRYFLAPMQDSEFLDRGVPHPIGPAIFVFAGGTCACYDEFKKHPVMDDGEFKRVKGPDFLSRLRATLDIPSLNFLTAYGPSPEEKGQPLGTFNPYGPVAFFPCQAAILLRRANILAFNLSKKAPGLIRADGSLNITAEVLRALLHLPQFEYGNRSFEALLDTSHLSGATEFTAALLPPAFQLSLHANPKYLRQLVETDYPLLPADRLAIAQEIQKRYQKQKPKDTNYNPASAALNDWEKLAEEFKEANFEQADDIANKLRAVKLWIRRTSNGKLDRAARDSGKALLALHVEVLAKAEHDRWCAQKYRDGWIAGRNISTEGRIDALLLHNCLFPWEQLSEPQKDLDREPIRAIPDFLADIGYEVMRE